MAKYVDLGAMATKILGNHQIKPISIKSTTVEVAEAPFKVTYVTVMFRIKRNYKPKPIFDALSANKIQYSRHNTSEDVLQIVMDLFQDGQKHLVSKLKESTRQKNRSDENSGSNGSSNGNLPYVGIPSGATPSALIQGTVKALVAAGYKEEAMELTKIAGEQDWDEFQRKMRAVFTRMKIHTRPEIRQLREHITSAIVQEMGPDVALLSGSKASDLEKQINDCIREHIDLIIDTKGIADSVLRRTASSLPPEQRTAQLRSIRNGFVQLHNRAVEAGDSNVALVAKTYVESLGRDLRNSKEGKSEMTVSLTDLAVSLVSAKKLDAAYLHLVGSSYDAK